MMIQTVQTFNFQLSCLFTRHEITSLLKRLTDSILTPLIQPPGCSKHVNLMMYPSVMFHITDGLHDFCTEFSSRTKYCMRD